MLGKVIKDLRAQKDITQEELAKNLGVTTSMVGMYETNARKPSYEVLNKIADFFGVSADYLLGRIVEPDKEKPQIRAIARKADKLSSEKLDLLQKLAESMAEEAENDKKA